MKRSMILAPLLLLLAACTQIANIPDDTLAKDIQIGAEKALEYGIKFAIQKEPAKADAIEKDAAVASSVIKTDILGAKGVFAGTTGDVLSGAVGTALDLLESKIPNQSVKDLIQLAISILSMKVTLPENPAAKLDDRTKKALVGLFTGISAGIDAALAAVAQPASVSRTARAAPAAPPKLSWPKK